jgi:MoxR-like ATPase
MIVCEREFVLFIDELNIASQEIQKAFYSLILDKRIGEYHLPVGSIIIGAGNRTQHDAALARQMPSALVNRMVHVHLKASAREWLAWAA